MRVFITLLGFNTPGMVRAAVENLEKTTTHIEHRSLIKTIFDPGYPGNDPAHIKAIAVDNGWWHTPIPNESVMGNHNRVIHDFYRMEPGDYYVCFDPDVRMQEVGWVSAMVEALNSDPNIVFCAASRRYHNEKWCSDQHGRTIHSLPSGLRVSKYRELIAWSTGMWKGEWLAARPRDFKGDAPVYGYTEHADIRLMQTHGKKWVALSDFYDDHTGGPDARYATWKQESADRKTEAKFEDWVRGK